jgi:hypothetical protein
MWLQVLQNSSIVEGSCVCDPVSARFLYSRVFRALTKIVTVATQGYRRIEDFCSFICPVAVSGWEGRSSSNSTLREHISGLPA